MFFLFNVYELEACLNKHQLIAGFQLWSIQFSSIRYIYIMPNITKVLSRYFTVEVS